MTVRSEDTVDPSTGPSRRIQQLNHLVQKEVAMLIKREIEFPLEYLVTVARVTVSPDAENARVAISVLPEEYGQDALKKIQSRIMDIQKQLNRRLVMKFVPKLTFVLDHQAGKADQVTQLLDSLTDGDLGVDR